MTQLDTYYEMLKEDLVKVIPVVEFHRERDFTDWDGQENSLLPCPMASKRHEEGDDSSPSLTVNPDSGAFKCFGCGWKGTSVVGYATDVHHRGNFRAALANLFAEYVRPLVSKEEVREYGVELRRRPRTIQAITSTRGWTRQTMAQLKLGWDPNQKRVAIPIFNLQGLCLDVRYHDSINRARKSKKGKRIPMMARRKGAATGDWFPLNPKLNPWAPEHDTIWIVEGEPDAILAHQEGLNVVTLTGGSSVWASVEHKRLRGFKGKNVIVCMDSDKAGQTAAKNVAAKLAAVGVRSLRNIKVPEGGDFSEFVNVYDGSADMLRQMLRLSPYVIRPQQENTATIPLAQTSQAEFIGKKVKTKVLINGIAQSPQAIPHHIEHWCTSGGCDQCPTKDGMVGEYFVAPDDPSVVDWLYAKSYANQIKREMGLGKNCPMQCTVKEWQTLEGVTMIPSLSVNNSDYKDSYVVRQGYVLGHGTESNQNYEVEAMPVIHPRTRESLLVVDRLKSSYDSISGFNLANSELEELQELFSDDPKTIIRDICRLHAFNHTHIYKRFDLHAAVDLAFHSPRDFSFAGVRLPKGSIELLLFGDTRCGKGQVAEGLVRFYDLGEVVSGENASLMGLAGGASKVGDQFRLTWGSIPLNHGRLVVVDEFSGLNSDVLGKLSRIRSEGIAELNKGGINSSTRANARLIWVANPKKGRALAEHSSGVSAIMDLVGADEDVARFDLAVVVQKGEVDVEEINQNVQQEVVSKYGREQLRKVVLWCWSRKPEHVVFTRRATRAILRGATDLAARYSSTIPLIQGENARFKIAKVAAAVAGRVFSTPDGVLLKVTEAHCRIAIELIRKFYDKPSMGYRTFSEIEGGTSNLTNREELDEFFRQFPKVDRGLLVDGLLSLDVFGVREVQDWCTVDGNIAKKFTGLFVRCQAVKQVRGGNYVKKPSFIKYLKRLKKRMTNG